ncbi:MAG: DUF1858 domain-containing protein [Candidatus ainarchaeum sp.]|nr:DUF1858 domain-containing protein [Candidatus ainarchaeum sp.]
MPSKKKNIKKTAKARKPVKAKKIAKAKKPLKAKKVLKAKKPVKVKKVKVSRPLQEPEPSKPVASGISGPVTGEMTFSELTSRHPSAIPVLFEFGLHCIGCHVSALETIEQGALAHGLSAAQLKEMLEKINAAVGKTAGN